MNSTTLRAGVVSALLALALVSAAMADEDPPGRVLRLSQIEGGVSFDPAGSADWAWAYVNRPLVSGDRLWVDTGARAELHVGPNAIHAGSRTNLGISLIDDHAQQYQITQGSFDLRLREKMDGEILEIDTPNLAFIPQQRGRYRIDVDPASQTTSVTILEGAGEVNDGHGNRTNMRGRQQIRFGGTALQELYVGDVPPRDDFQFWADARLARDDSAAASAQYVPPGVTGYEDLNENGVWEQDGEYGAVWIPRVAMADWAPYRYGRWIWVSPWGWTWCDDAPWGFAPFHYGRWVQLRGRWGWVPGPVAVRAVYSPAMVGFVGGSGIGVSISVGAPVAWVPLAPGERLRPWYATSNNYLANVNRTVIVNNTTIVQNNTYINQRVVGGVTAVSGEQFSRGLPVQRGLVKGDPKQWRNAQPVNQIAIRPTEESRFGAMHQAAVGGPSRVVPAVVSVRAAPEPAAMHDRQLVPVIHNDQRWGGQNLSHNPGMGQENRPAQQGQTMPQTARGNGQPGNAQNGSENAQSRFQNPTIRPEQNGGRMPERPMESQQQLPQRPAEQQQRPIAPPQRPVQQEMPARQERDRGVRESQPGVAPAAPVQQQAQRPAAEAPRQGEAAKREEPKDDRKKDFRKDDNR